MMNGLNNLKRNNMCTYTKDSVEPCKTCPRLITALYTCKLLQEISKEKEE